MLCQRLTQLAHDSQVQRSVNSLGLLVGCGNLENIGFMLVWIVRQLNRRKEDFSGAITDIGKALEFEPNNAIFYRNRGNARKAQGDLDGAMVDFNKAIELKPDYSEAYHARGNARKDERDFDRAITDLSEALRLGSSREIVLCNRGLAKSLKGDHCGALADDVPEAYVARAG
jgi:Flp pilus assembly protein TadD